jgi:hypothetical protein
MTDLRLYLPIQQNERYWQQISDSILKNKINFEKPTIEGQHCMTDPDLDEHLLIYLELIPKIRKQDHLDCIYDYVYFDLDRHQILSKSEKKWLMIFNSLSKYSKVQLEKLDKAIKICNLYYNHIRAKTKLQYEFDTLVAQNKNIPHFEANFNWKKISDSNTVIRAITAEKLKQDQLKQEKNSESDWGKVVGSLNPSR